MREAVAVLPDNGSTTATVDETRTEEHQLDVSVVMPCLNEEDSIAICVQKAKEWLGRSSYRGEVLVVDNGSTNRSRELALAAGALILAGVGLYVFLIPALDSPPQEAQVGALA